MSTWKLTKKLKETHLSPFQKSSSSPTSSGTGINSNNNSAEDFQKREGTVNLPSVTAHSQSGSTSRSDTLSGNDSSINSNHTKSSSKTLTNDSPYVPTSQSTGTAPANPQPTPIPAGVDPASEKSGPSTSTITPGLLTVTVMSAKGLSLPPQASSLQGGTSSSTQPPPNTTATTPPHQQRMGTPSSSPRKQASQRRPPVYIVLDYDKTQVILDAGSGTIESPTWDKIQSFDVSRAESLSIQIYTRIPLSNNSGNASIPNSFSGTPLSIGSVTTGRSNKKRMYEDVFLGSCKVKVTGTTASSTVIAEGWQTLTSGSGKVNLKVDFRPNKKGHLTIDDFDLLKVVGKGSFGKVMQVRKHDTQRVYALKTIRKAHIVSRSEVNHTLAERTVLAQIDNPFIVPLKFSFQSPEKLYLVLAFVNGGELFHHLQREGRFDLNRSRFYTAELLCALECLHEYNVIYRDLKPENILLDYTGHIALCDFGLCKLNMAGQEKTNTFCGTPEYLAPELLLGQGYTKVVDWWTLGVLFYEMLTGLPPFYDQDTNEMYRKILQDPLRFPEDMDREARSLLQGLLDRDPKKRLGVNGAAEIKSHPFFAQIDWRRLMAKKYAAPFKPDVESATDTSNFDQEFTSEEPTDSVVDKDFYLSESVQQQFGGWTYTNTDSKLASSGRW